MIMEEQRDKHIDKYAFLLLVEVNRAIYTVHWASFCYRVVVKIKTFCEKNIFQFVLSDLKL